jgi:hypothetical protein
LIGPFNNSTAAAGSRGTRAVKIQVRAARLRATLMRGPDLSSGFGLESRQLPRRGINTRRTLVVPGEDPNSKLEH